jgi:hypothetical protein
MRWLLAVALMLALATVARAQTSEEQRIAAFLAKLSAPQRAEFLEWRTAQSRHEAALGRFWAEVNERRVERRRKRSGGLLIEAADYAAGFPPDYAGPKLSATLAKLWAEEQQKRDPPRPQPVVADFLAEAQRHYQFVPVRLEEAEFKQRYAAEAIAVGLTKEQVVRVYALETGGMGTADMQAGINPQTGKGNAISSALGYAQLLHANSVSEIVKHGERFIERLRAEAAKPATSAVRAGELQDKVRALRKMLARARSVPNEWSAHVRFASTPEGLGIHALNLDADIGPWLQVIKLQGIRELAQKEGRPRLTGAELEIMNLAGPLTGLEMMTPLGGRASTPNFFSRQGYERNSIVRGRTGAELLVEIDKRMDVAVERPGSVEFARAFEAAAGGPAPGRP